MKRGFLIICALVLTIYAVGMWGCSKEISGPPRVNQPPHVQFVNIPVEGTQFSADTSIYWYGTDVDGFIRYYRYAVVESSMVARLAGDDIVAFVANHPDSIDWTVLEVTLQNPQTSARIKLKADSLDPVRSFVASYIILQAIDNLGAESEVAFRLFKKNNHFPETTIGFVTFHDPYVNARDSSGVLEGVRMTWSATDPIDYPRNPPPFQYRWRCFGPFSKAGLDSLKKYLRVRIFVDAFGDYYQRGDSLKILSRVDTTINNSVTPPETTFTPIYTYYPVNNLGAANQALGKWRNYFIGAFRGLDTMIFSQDSLLALKQWRDSLDPAVNPGILVKESQGWGYDQRTNLYNLFANEEVDAGGDTTRTGYFIFTCQSRDDSDVPDKVPSHTFFQAIEIGDPDLRRDLFIIDLTKYDATSYANVNYPIFGNFISGALGSLQYDIPLEYKVRNVYGDFANSWKSGSFDATKILDEVYGPTPGTFIGYSYHGCTQDYISTCNLGTLDDTLGLDQVPLRDLLKHKVVLLYKDDPFQSIPTDTRTWRSILRFMNSGGSVWTMARAPFGEALKDIDFAYSVPVNPVYRLYFSIDSIFFSGWQGINNDHVDDSMAILGGQPIDLPYRDKFYRIEDFIGGDAITGNAVGVPDVYIDTALVKQRYIYQVWDPPEKVFYYPYPYIDTIPALPEVGAIEPLKLPGYQSLYLYTSRYHYRVENGQIVESFTGRVPKYVTDWSMDFQGRICAMAFETQIFKTSHFQFPLMAMDQTSAQQVFNKMMDWLTVQPYLQTGKASTSSTAGRVSVSKLRAIEEEYNELYRNGLLSDQKNAANAR